MIIEMVAYKALHQSAEDSWRCMICPGTKKYTKTQIYAHLIDAHQHDERDLSFDKTGEEIYKEYSDENEEIDVEIDLEGFEEEEYIFPDQNN